jgi:hypothetical protein
MPDKPPYTAHLGNLAFDVTQSDIESFLSGCEVTNIRIVEDKLDMKPKGFGYVEFATVDGLKKALTLTESSFMGRNIRISVAEPRKFSCHLRFPPLMILTLLQPRSARNQTATSPTGPARALFLTCPARVVSLQGLSSVAPSRTDLMPAARLVAARGLATSRTTAKFATSETGLARVLFPPALLLLFPLARAVATPLGVRDVDLMLDHALPARSSRREPLLSVPLLLPTRTANGARRCVLTRHPSPALRHPLPPLPKLLRLPRSARD